MSDRTGERDALIGVSAALATRDREVVRGALERAAAVADAERVEEAILQAHLFIGFPDVLEALTLWREIAGPAERRTETPPADGWRARGEQICARVYGSNYDKLRANVPLLHPELDRWMVETGYGRVIGRDALDLVTRELCIVALLAAWGAERQLHSHLRGALNVGAAPDEVSEALDAAARLAPGHSRQASELWRRVQSRFVETGGGGRRYQAG